MSTILLIRHGESESNVGYRTTDHKSVELTEQGEHQAERIARYLADQIPPVLIVTSPYLRARRTAERTTALIKHTLPNARQEVWPVQEFTYLASEDFPEPSNAEDRKPLVDTYWEECVPAFKDGPDAESFEQFIKRVQDVIQGIKDISKEVGYETIAIFSHEQFIRAFQWITEGKLTMPDAEAMREFRNDLRFDPLPNGAILRAEIDGDPKHWVWELPITSHLKPKDKELESDSSKRIYAEANS